MERRVETPDGFVQVLHPNGEYHIIHRYASRGKINNYVANYEKIHDNYESELVPLDAEYANKILDRIEDGQDYSAAFVFYEGNFDSSTFEHETSQEEHKFTSTGIKFWRHQQQMFEFKNGGSNTVISTHISPEGSCNLKCPYCSVTYRDTHSRLELETIKNYVLNLKSRGLRAVILTGGGEPTAYKHFNELVRWLKEQDLSVALITNGTLTRRIENDVWNLFSWIRVSINIFDGWEEKIGLPLGKIDTEKVVVGCSMVYTVEHELSLQVMTNRVELLSKVSAVADKCGARYIRLLPNCLLPQRDLIRQHRSLDKTLEKVNDSRFFHQYKVHGAPKTSTCHQSRFRPYLSEEIHIETGKPGAVYPCDSVVLNEGYTHFASKYQLCHADNVLDFIDRKIYQGFDAKKDCTGCVFTKNVDMLDDFMNNKTNRFDEFSEPLEHEEFV